MRLWRGLSKRIVGAAILCGLVGLLTSQALVRIALHEVIIRACAPFARAVWRDHGRAQCEAAPESWAFTLENGTRAYAYDGDTLRSRNPAAPPIDPALARLRGDDLAVETHPFGGGGLAFRGAASGPCAIVHGAWPALPTVRGRTIVVVAIGAALASIAAAALALAMVVRPLVGRIDRLRRAAERVGADDDAGGGDARYESAEPRGAHDDELHAVSASLDRAHARIREDARALERRQRELERFVADVAHDLRTPIASLQIALEAASDASAAREAGALAGRALKDVVYLAGLTGNLRLATRLRDGWTPSATEARVDLVDTIERVVGRARVFAQRQSIALDAAVPDGAVIARGEPIATEQAIANVVENAIAYGDRGGHVAVILERDGASFVLTVEDDGPGVADTEIPRLGERTFRSDDARQRDPRGSGLGLAITSEVCRACGWALRFEHASPRGLRVVVRGAAAGA